MTSCRPLNDRSNMLWRTSAVWRYPFRLLSPPLSSTKLTSSGSQAAPDRDERIVWVDLEMTGLEVEKDYIIEAACIITDGQLKIVEEGPNLIIHQPPQVMENMNEWCKEQHGKTGLTKAVLKSDISIKTAEAKMLDFVKKHTTAKGCPLAGNSIYMDKMFLQKYMPDFVNHLHYRIIDVSSIKELCQRWYPEIYESSPLKAGTHRALDDIKESIKELEFYRKNIFCGNII